MGEQKVALLGICDFNVPHAKEKANTQALARQISAVLEDGSPDFNSVLLVLPDTAKTTSKRGLLDEELSIVEALHAFDIQADTRFVELFSRETGRANSKSNTRKWGQGHQNSEAFFACLPLN